LAITSEDRTRLGRELRFRYTAADLAVLTSEEARRFAPAGHRDPRRDAALAWELLYRLEPGLYDRLATAERLHPGILSWLPRDVPRIVEVGAGTGRLTLELIHRGQQVVAIEPAAGLRAILGRKLQQAPRGCRARLSSGFLDDLPVDSGWADLVVACSVVTPAAAHGGDVGLAELERVCRPGGQVVIVWPNHVDWLAARGYDYLSFGGPMAVEFASHADAVELTAIFYPGALAEVRRRGLRKVPFDLLGINPPRDLAWKAVAR
jgi:SAM-dependent methyltransferase